MHTEDLQQSSADAITLNDFKKISEEQMKRAITLAFTQAGWFRDLNAYADEQAAVENNYQDFLPDIDLKKLIFSSNARSDLDRWYISHADVSYQPPFVQEKYGEFFEGQVNIDDLIAQNPMGGCEVVMGIEKTLEAAQGTAVGTFLSDFELNLPFCSSATAIPDKDPSLANPNMVFEPASGSIAVMVLLLVAIVIVAYLIIRLAVEFLVSTVGPAIARFWQTLSSQLFPPQSPQIDYATLYQSAEWQAYLVQWEVTVNQLGIVRISTEWDDEPEQVDSLEALLRAAVAQVQICSELQGEEQTACFEQLREAISAIRALFEDFFIALSRITGGQELLLEYAAKLIVVLQELNAALLLAGQDSLAAVLTYIICVINDLKIDFDVDASIAFCFDQELNDYESGN
ncbi:MAG: hypothetical protein IPJ88_13170 [Myxococcales bacterium]|nr:MAG: hypothetical protein IPJ88_13170 [Myxococcales bacterium]